MTNIISHYHEEIQPKLMEEFNLKNKLATPDIQKIVINVGAKEALSTKDVLEKIKEQLGAISGQKPKVTKAKKSISSFKLKQGDLIGVMVTLRKRKAWDFLEKFLKVVLPRMRDFRGVPLSKFDASGNFNFGITEQILFPEIEYSKIDKIRGLVVSIVFKNSNKEKSKRFLELLGMPFEKN